MYSCSQVADLGVDSQDHHQVYESTSWMPQKWRWEQSVLQNFPLWNEWCSEREHWGQMQPSATATRTATFQSKTETSSSVSLDHCITHMDTSQHRLDHYPCPSSLMQCCATIHIWLTDHTITCRVYFRPLKKGVVLPLAIVKKGVELPLEHIKKG